MNFGMTVSSFGLNVKLYIAREVCWVEYRVHSQCWVSFELISVPHIEITVVESVELSFEKVSSEFWIGMEFWILNKYFQLKKMLIRGETYLYWSSNFFILTKVIFKSKASSWEERWVEYWVSLAFPMSNGVVYLLQFDARRSRWRLCGRLPSFRGYFVDFNS